MLFRWKKRSPLRRKKTSWLTPQLLGVLFVILSLALMLVFAPEKEEYPTDFLSRAMNNPIAAIQSIRNMTHTFIRNMADNFHAKAELQTLRIEMEKIQNENVELHYKLRQLENFREALNLPRTESYRTVPAIVCRRDNRMTNSFVIDRGTEAGLSINQAVMCTTGMVGRTYRLRPHAAWVQLLTDPGCTIPVYVKDTPYEGILRGREDRQGLVLTDQYLKEMGDETRTPEPGQAVFTSGVDKVFQRDLLAGYITSGANEEGLSVIPAVDFDAVKAVYVILNTVVQEEMLSLLIEED
ncbi:MAG: rod shape-determining protein MreC [Candidatus Omnitrophota bacterium]|jgi:rod shape-determining protein MreC|nr:MAG: rod shape-determining protein MreC [Candidatus Omnitrophota bacterium]